MRLLGAACMLVAGTAALVRADGATAPVAPISIEYVASAGCPDEISLRAGVIARLGQDPFRGGSPRHAVIDVTHTAAGFVAAIELQEPGREPTRRVVGPAQRCEDAVDALELALAVIIDPTSGSVPSPQPMPQPPMAQPAAPQYYAPPGWSASLAPRLPPTSELAIAFGSLAGAHPESAFTFGVRASYLIGTAWSAGLNVRGGSARGDLDSARTYASSSAELIAEGCTRQWLLIACALVGVGSKSVTIERDEGMFVVTTVADYSDPYFLLGAGLSFDVPLGRAFLRPSINGTFPLPAVGFESEGVEQYGIPILQFGFDLALGYRW